MPRALDKVQKHISKKKGGKINALHENSRDARRLRQAGAREEKIHKLVTAAARSNQRYVDRVQWFKEAIEGSAGTVSDDEMHLLTQSFISREDDELAVAKSQRRPGRPPTKEEEQISQRIDDEQREFKAGLWVPDLRDEDGRQKLEKWGGSWAGLNTLSFVRVVKDRDIKKSSFPPKGLS